jgi:hypothetical protein
MKILKGKNNLSTAVELIISLEDKLAEKENLLGAARQDVDAFYMEAALSADSKPRKATKLKSRVEELELEIKGIRDVIAQAIKEAADLATIEMENAAARKNKLKEQEQSLILKNHGKLLSALQEVFLIFHSICGVESVINKNGFTMHIPPLEVTLTDIEKINAELIAAYKKNKEGPFFIAQETTQINDQLNHFSPQKAVEKALQDARTAPAQRVKMVA